MFNGTGGQGVGNFIAKDTTVREVRTTKKQKKTLRGRRRSCSKKMHNRPGSIPLHVCLAVFRGVAVYAYHMAKIVALGHSPSCAKCGQLDKYLRQDALCSKTTTCRECNDDR